MATQTLPRERPNALMTALAALVLALVVGPIGTAVFVVGFVHGDSPCILCWAQRTGMVLIALTGLFILRYGPRPRYIGLALLIAVYGVYMAIRHSALHIARDIGQGFSTEILGAHTNTWSLLIFWTAAIAMALLVALLRDGEATRRVRSLTRFETAVAWLFLAAVAGNAVQAFASTGPPPYTGQSDPVRFSFNPANWVWSLEEWAPVPMSLRGRWAVPRPSHVAVPTDPAAGPFAGLPRLGPVRTLKLPALDAPVSGLAYDPASDRFLVTTASGVALLDAALSRVLARAVVDPVFSVDLARFVDGAFLESGTVLALGENKSFVVLKENPQADAQKSFRHLLVPGPFEEISRGRFVTVRARLMFVGAVAMDTASNQLFTVSVPTTPAGRFVVSAFDRGDMALSREFVPAVDAASPALKDGRSVDELHVTGLAVHEGMLHALSAAYRTLVAIDPATRRLTATAALDLPANPTGMALKDGQLYVACEDGSVAVIEIR